MPQTKIALNVLYREKGIKCCNCQSVEDIQYHHIVPMSSGGLDIISNIAPLCPICHALVHSKKSMASSTLIKQGIAKAKAEGKTVMNRVFHASCPNKHRRDGKEREKQILFDFSFLHPLLTPNVYNYYCHNNHQNSGDYI